MKIRAVGTMVYAVHRKYVREKITGGRILVCKIRSYENVGGVIRAILKQIGSNKMEVSTEHYRIYHNLPDAIIAITTKKKAK